ncbi:hypothetical protein [Nitrosopumilus sp.]|uniref:hypothetical protein n=1 Tax=Nitrosopumilus sp. TaxID=2024843 RepID=UPI0034A094B9
MLKFIIDTDISWQNYNIPMEKKKVIKEKFCMSCKSKDNLQVSINLLSDPAYLCSKCISDYDSWKKKMSKKES